MPFISQDWRGPGEDWVKVDDGWEIKKVSVLQRDGVKRRRTKTEGDRWEEEKNAVIRSVINKQRSWSKKVKLERREIITILCYQAEGKLSCLVGV